MYPAGSSWAGSANARRRVRILAGVERPFRVIEWQVRCVKRRPWGRARKTARQHMMFALVKRWMARRKLVQAIRG